MRKFLGLWKIIGMCIKSVISSLVVHSTALLGVNLEEECGGPTTILSPPQPSLSKIVRLTPIGLIEVYTYGYTLVFGFIFV